MQSAYLCQHVHSLHLWHCRAKGVARCCCLLFKMKTLPWCHLSLPSRRQVLEWTAQFRWRDASSLLSWGLTQLSQTSCCSDRITTLSIRYGAVASRGPYITPKFWLGLGGSESFLLLHNAGFTYCAHVLHTLNIVTLMRGRQECSMQMPAFLNVSVPGHAPAKGLNGKRTCLD